MQIKDLSYSLAKLNSRVIYFHLKRHGDLSIILGVR
jgi:hypothetical protein